MAILGKSFRRMMFEPYEVASRRPCDAHLVLPRNGGKPTLGDPALVVAVRSPPDFAGKSEQKQGVLAVM
ncbi:hypothetical protein [Sulfidibacter corallicola]